MPQELSLATGQKTETRNAFSKNMWTNIILTKPQLPKELQSGWFFSKILANLSNAMRNLGKKAVLDLATALAKDDLPRFVSNIASIGASNAINKY